MKARLLLCILTILAASQSSFAQAYGAAYQSFINTLQTNNVWKSISKGASTTGTKRSSGSTGPTSTPPPSYREIVRNTAVTPEQVTRAVQFKSTRSRLALDEYVEALRADVGTKAEWKVRLTELLDRFDALAAAKGYPNDISFALAYNIVLNRAVYHETPILADAQVSQMRDQLAIDLTRGEFLNNATDREKQGIYEFSVMTSTMAYYCSEKAKSEKDMEELKGCKMLAAQNLKLLGLQP